MIHSVFFQLLVLGSLCFFSLAVPLSSKEEQPWKVVISEDVASYPRAAVLCENNYGGRLAIVSNAEEWKQIIKAIAARPCEKTSS